MKIPAEHCLGGISFSLTLERLAGRSFRGGCRQGFFVRRLFIREIVQRYGNHEGKYHVFDRACTPFIMQEFVQFLQHEASLLSGSSGLGSQIAWSSSLSRRFLASYSASRVSAFLTTAAVAMKVVTAMRSLFLSVIFCSPSGLKISDCLRQSSSNAVASDLPCRA